MHPTFLSPKQVHENIAFGQLVVNSNTNPKKEVFVHRNRMRGMYIHIHIAVYHYVTLIF